MISLERFWNFPRILRFFEELDDSKFLEFLEFSLSNRTVLKNFQELYIFSNSTIDRIVYLKFWSLTNRIKILAILSNLDLNQHQTIISKSLTLNNLEKEKKRNQINVSLNLEDFFIGRLVVSHLDLVTTSIPKNSIHGIPGCFPNCIVEGRARMKIDKIDE